MSIYGLMNKNCFISPDSSELSFWKTKSKSKLVKCVDPLDIEVFSASHPEVKQINYMYLDSPTNVTGESSMDQIESIIDSSFLLGKINRRNHKDIFESIQKYKKTICVETDFEHVKNREKDIVSMIETWRYSQSGGMKYGWIEHAGIDKACVRRYLSDPDFRARVDFYLFLDKVSGKVIGYSMIERTLYLNLHRNDDLFEVPYLIRKCLVEGLRNITEYIDWYTFNDVMRKNGLNELIVNWGCSSGGVHWYKTHKWPVYKIEKKLFSSWKKEKSKQ